MRQRREQHAVHPPRKQDTDERRRVCVLVFLCRSYRDVDVEGMTDGWDDPTAYGYDWRGNTAFRLSARNSGLFYVRATHETLAMMSRLKRRMETEAVWDQTAYNEEMW